MFNFIINILIVVVVEDCTNSITDFVGIIISLIVIINFIRVTTMGFSMIIINKNFNIDHPEGCYFIIDNLKDYYITEEVWRNQIIDLNFIMSFINNLNL